MGKPGGPCHQGDGDKKDIAFVPLPDKGLGIAVKPEILLDKVQFRQQVNTAFPCHFRENFPAQACLRNE